jgi:type IV secretion system coupling TraD/TrwB family protein
MANRSVFTEEGRTRWRNFGLRLRSYLILFLVLGVGAGVFVFVKWTRGGMGPLERLYFRQFAKSTALSLVMPDRKRQYVLLVSEWGGRSIGVTDEIVYLARDDRGQAVRDQHGWLFKPYSAGIAQPRWKFVRLSNAAMEAWLRQNIYGGESLPGLFVPALIACLVTAVLGTFTAIIIDQRLNGKYEHGQRLRGNRLVEPDEYEREMKEADGLALVVKKAKPEGGLKRLSRKLTRSSEPVWRLRMKRSAEAQGMLILGDTGSGKSRIIDQYLRQIARRESETAVIYDPACEFVKAHYNSRRGDVILNPLDARSPFWSAVFEQKYRTDYQLLAKVFFPGKKIENHNESFFLHATRDIFARMLEQQPHPEQLIEWLSDSSGQTIDRMTQGTELAHYIGPKAADQRGGVLGNLTKVGKTLRLLPRELECEFDFSLTEWAGERRGWIFLTSTTETEEQLRPLYAAYIELIIRRLMSSDGRQCPVKVFLDELHTLDYLPVIEKLLAEGRKHGISVFIGTQNKKQIDERYGRDAASTMLSQSRHKIVMRCNEPESAGWVSMVLDDEEIEKPRTGITASVSDQGRDSITYSSHTERRAVVSRAEITALEDLQGYWKYGDKVVPFRIDFNPGRDVAEGFVPRRTLAPVKLAREQESAEIAPPEAPAEMVPEMDEEITQAQDW